MAVFAIVGLAASGKSTSIKHLTEQDKCIYANAEVGKRPPFKHEFNHMTVKNPVQFMETLEQLVASGKYNSYVIDSIDYLMEMYVTTHVLTSDNAYDSWNNYKNYFVKLMSLAESTPNSDWIFNAHVALDSDKRGGESWAIPAAGKLKRTGVESYFTNIVAASLVDIGALTPNKYLNITPREELLGFKNVFQTQLTADVMDMKIRSPEGTWAPNEIYIDNNAQYVCDAINNFYK